ncbi:MAG: flagellar assembly protein FliW [Bacillus sp. (in: firmicutes)]
MKIMTKYHGELQADEKELWHFPKGIPGFPDEKKFLLYPLADNEIFSILQSAAHPDIAFVAASPFSFFRDYEFTLDESAIAILGVEDAHDVLPLVILTLGESLESSTTNLQAPIILNVKNRQGKQVILHDAPYHTKHTINEKVGQG